jgi:hypothetical protein
VLHCIILLFSKKVFSTLQQESAKRTALEQNLHAQLLLQSETMMAMELKLLRLEARVKRRPEAATPTTGRLTSQRASIPSPAVRSPPAPPTPETLQQQSIRPRTTYPNPQPQQKQQAQNSNIHNIDNVTELLSGSRLVPRVSAGSLAGGEGEDREGDVGSQQSSTFKTLPCNLFVRYTSNIS